VSSAISEEDVQRAPCLEDGPIAESGRAVVAASRGLGSSRWASVLRAWCVPYLFDSMERVFASGEEPVAGINAALRSLEQFLLASGRSGFGELGLQGGAAEDPTSNDAIAEVTGEHYGRLFREFSSPSYWDEPVSLLRQRLERNEVSLADLDRKEVLDAGCGGGRYTVAWRLLGAKRATGIDISPTGVMDARRRVEEAGIDGVIFTEGSVLDLPFPPESFDLVYSNGVLHHTVDWKTGIHEAVRVLKPGGLAWLYLIENPGGLYWDLVEILRVVTKDEQRDVARAAVGMLGIPANRAFYMLDHVMAPVNVRLTPQQVEECLQAAGATGIRRLVRGADNDRSERIYQGEPYAAVKYGVGENRYVFSRE
jgi:ubiquinone/menaquinone biosynthesis C-methylase UbiE